MQGPIHHIGDPYALEVEDVKSAITPILYCLPSPDPSFSQKDDDAQI